MCLMAKDSSNQPLMPMSQDSRKRTVWGKVRGQQGMSLEPCASEAALLTPVMQAYSLLWYPRRGQLWWEVGLVSSQLSKGYRLPKAA